MELQELVQRIERWKSRQAGDVVPEPEAASVLDEIEAVEDEAIAEAVDEVEAVAVAEEAVPEASVEEAIEVEGEEGDDGTSEVAIEQIEAEAEEEP